MIKRCSRCVTPLSRPGIIVDEYGICSACKWEDMKNDTLADPQIEKLKTEMNHILSSVNRKMDFDCLVTVSGGKDSHYQTYIATKILKLKTLTVTWACCDSTATGKANLENLIRAFNVAHVMIRPAPAKYSKEMKEGLIKDGDCCMPCHHGIFSEASRIARAFEIPIIIWGENPRAEYGGGAEVGEDQPMAMADVRHIYLGDYLPWDAREQVGIVEKYGFESRSKPPHGAWLTYENVDCGYVGIHDYFAWLKFGMSRAAIQLSLEIRKGRMTRFDALEILNKIEPVDRPDEEVDAFLEFSGMTMPEFEECEQRWTDKSIIQD